MRMEILIEMVTWKHILKICTARLWPRKPTPGGIPKEEVSDRRTKFEVYRVRYLM
ncbi:hypothetical protein BGW80DRAFT_1340632 [Lactifluus volemus]|nr:hypothetical protein BGW80DRAFT_1340632 [Lactifluus volemus]